MATDVSGTLPHMDDRIPDVPVDEPVEADADEQAAEDVVANLPPLSDDQ